MALYTFESPNSIPRLTTKLVVVDTSYLIAFSNPTDHYYQIISDFHQKAIAVDTSFQINVIVRQELIKDVRASQFAAAMLDLADADSALAAQYRTWAGWGTNTVLTTENLKKRCDNIYKGYVKQNNIQQLLNAVKRNIWDEADAIEKSAKVEYVSGLGTLSWDGLEPIIKNFGLSPTDAMILNFAIFVEADAIVTTDADYSTVADIIDVYLPERIAQGCAVYDASID